jgi:glyoxalase-like protein
MATLDHIHIGSANVYTTAHDLMKATKLGHFDGGFDSSVIVGSKIVPLGDSYLEIASLVDPFAAADAAKRPWWYTRAVAVKSAIFSGVCLRVNTMAELAEIAKRHGGAVRPSPQTFTPPDGPPQMFRDAPYSPGARDPWESGKPTWCCWEDRLYMHPSGQPVVNAPGLVEPTGIAWMEMGGTKADMQQWLGQNPDDLRMTFNGKSPGLYAIGVKTDAGVVEIRKPSATGA